MGELVTAVGGNVPGELLLGRPRLVPATAGSQMTGPEGPTVLRQAVGSRRRG